MVGRKQKTAGHPPVVVIGAGIMGLSTAYYLASARMNGRSITIVDNAPILFAGASGKANGLLGDYGFGSEVESLGKLSWELHQRLASLNQGRSSWGYRDVMIYKMQGTASSAASNVSLGSRYPASPLPMWCRDLKGHASKLVSNHEHSARINPLDFCKFLQKSCEEMGVQILLNTTVTGVEINHGSLNSVTIKRNRSTTTLECHSLVIAAGPWSESVLSELFPHSQVRIPSSEQPNSGNYIIAKVPGWDPCPSLGVCHQIYLEGLLDHEVDISSRSDGTVYIGGSLSAQEELPETATSVQPQTRYVRKMTRLLERALGCSPNDVEILERGRAYRPCLEHGRPIITQVSLDDLLGMTHREPIERGQVGRGGVYLNVGHGRDGITLGPGSGKVMSELIEGVRAPSADISGLRML